VLSQLGVAIGPLLAGLGVASFIVGFALQDTLSNFAAGMLILAYRPFDVGDEIAAGGVSGHVEQMTLVTTTILTNDHQRLIVPNSKICGEVITNLTAENMRRIDLGTGTRATERCRVGLARGSRWPGAPGPYVLECVGR
jgi:small conductance mechanosensitive channel